MGTSVQQAQDLEKQLRHQAELQLQQLHAEFSAAAARWQSDTEARLEEASVQYNEMALHRQREVKAAVKELQALSQGQQMLRAELRRNARPALLPSTYVPSPPRGMERLELLHMGPQRWQEAYLHLHGQNDGRGVRLLPNRRHQSFMTEAFAALPPPVGSQGRGSLLTGRIQEQVQFLQKQMCQLEERQRRDSTTWRRQCELQGDAD